MPVPRRPMTKRQSAVVARARTVRLRRMIAVVLLAAGVGAVWVWAHRAAGSADAGVALDPTGFSPGACVAFAPTMGDRHTTVFLDAGHGGLDPGAVGTTS
jgi:N-acetylmuramoyl-L-alanine amidase